MISPGINRFLTTLLYPVIDPALLFDDPFDAFFTRLPNGFITPENKKAIQGNKKRAFDAAAAYMAKYYSMDSYDQVFQYMERWYLGQSVWRPGAGSQKEPPLLYDLVFRRLCQLTNSMISKLDGQIIYKYWETEGDAALLGGFAGHDKIHLFRGLNQIIPMDILAAIFVMGNPDAETALRSFYGHIAITDAPLEQILSRGVAENHLHMGAATGFSIIWEDLMRPDISLTNPWPALGSPGMPSKAILYFYWLMARCLRMGLAQCTPSCAEICGGGAGAEVMQALLPENLSALYSFLCANPAETDCTLEYFLPVDRALSAAALSGASPLLCPQSTLQLTEPHFLLRMFTAFAGRSGASLGRQKRMLLQYLRIKHHIFRLMVQAKTLSGLDYFQNYYRAASSINRTAARSGRNITGSNAAFLERQIRSQLSTPHIRRVEFRTSFCDREADARRFLHRFLQAYRNVLLDGYCAADPETGARRPVRPFPRVGIVFHFLKSRQEAPDVCFCAEDSALRSYSELHERYRAQLEVFRNLRDPVRYPGIDRYLVGIDAASLENSVPTWVFRDIYESARDGKTEPFSLARKRPFQSLGFTFHAGEDFRHLFSGLRRVYEVVHFLKFHAGDRLGHGLALGIDVDDWCREHTNVLLPRIEALENYIWAYRMLSTYPSEQNTGNLLYLEQRIHCLSGEIFRAPGGGEESPAHIPVPVLLQSYEALFRRDLFSPEYHKCAGGCGQENPGQCPLLGALSFSVENILEAYHCFHYTKRMNEPVHYHLQPQEVLILKDLQAMLQRYVSMQGVIVEANPSSNVVIGQMDTIHEHPLYQFSSCRCDYKDIMVCVNSDDPGVFQTNTANELGIAYMGMVERGIGRESCLAWIDRLRESGMRGSFIRRTDSDEELLRELDALIEEL